MNSSEKNKIRKPYEKPDLRPIELVTEEVMGIGCKNNQGGFNVASTPCMANQCVKNGS
jgi:hypothetical protein